MPVDIELSPDDDLLHLIYTASIDPDDLRYIETESVRITEHLDGPMFRIHDMRELKLAFGDLVVLLFDAARAAKKRPGAVGDPKFSELVVMKPGTLAAFGVKSMSQRQYGGFNFPVFDTPDEALDYAKHNQP